MNISTPFEGGGYIIELVRNTHRNALILVLITVNCSTGPDISRDFYGFRVSSLEIISYGEKII
jgi:hypothetical protein